MRYFSLFTGIGGFELGIKRATNNKWKCVGYSEIDKYAIQTFEKNFKGLKNYGDTRNIRTEELPDFDLLCGGFPCQTFSIAGKRKGFGETRGSLFFEIIRIAKDKKPQYLLLENVKGLLSADNGWCFAEILRSLDELGYDCEWQVLNSKFFGVPQNRERVFIVGYLRGKPSKKVFPIGECYQNNERISKESKREKMRVHDLCISQTIQTDGFGATIIDESQKQREGLRFYDKFCPSLNTAQGGGHIPIVHSLFPKSSKTNQGGTGHLKKQDGTSYCLDGGNCQALEISPCITTELAHSTGKHWTPQKFKQVTGQLRRLTPKECERLQGFPDNWTEGVSDTQRYKQLGNAVTVDVIEAIINSFRLIK